MLRLKNSKLFFWFSAAAWMTLIFVFSSIRGSGEHPWNIFYFIERKSFHVIEYFVLLLLLYGAFYRDVMLKRALFFSAAIAFLYAASDEWHQTFIFGREGTVRDVVIDMFGIFLASILVVQSIKWQKRRKQLN